MFPSKVRPIAFFALLLSLTLVLTSCGQKRVILTNVTETDANQIIVLLESKGIKAEKMLVKSSGAAAQSSQNMWDISVDHPKAVEALAILNRIGLPRPPSISILDLFPGQGMMKTETEEQIRYVEGLNEQLAGTIRKIDGVLDAEVNVSIPTEDVFNPDAIKELPRASVFIKHDGIFDAPNNLLTQKIRRFISASVSDLRYEDVAVITDRARFTDINLRSLEPKSDATPWGTQDYVKIWSIIVSNESIGAFRTILFLFSFFSLLFVLLIGWSVWKFKGMFKQLGGVKSFFSTEPFNITIHKTNEANSKKIEEDEPTPPDEELPGESEL